MGPKSHLKALIAAVSALLAIFLGRPAMAAGPHYVFAHYMVCFGTYGQTIQGYERDIQDAQAAGIDGFALDLPTYNDPSPQYAGYTTCVGLLYSAAQQLGTNFKFIFSLEMTDTNAILALIRNYAGNPNTFYYGTNMVVSTYGQNQFNVDWKNSVFAPLQRQGISVCFVPFFWPNPVGELPGYNDAVNILNTYTNILSGLFLFGGAGLPAQLATCNSNYNAAVHAAGKIYMAGMSPHYWGCVQYSIGRRYFETDGGEGTIAQWNSIIANQPDWVEIVTWNDFNESSYISPVNNPEQYENVLAPLHRYCHAGYLELSKRFIAWYKTGVPPATNNDALFYFYRIHPMNLAVPGTNDVWVANRIGDIADVIYNTVFLAAPAQLKVMTGTNTVTYSLGAGLQQLRTPFSTGPQSFTLSRNGAQILSAQGPPILSAITNYDFFPASGYAYGPVVPSSPSHLRATLDNP
jgi:glucan endo-1,3-alpha-glucosidase